MKINSKFILLVHTLESFFTTWALMEAARLQPGNLLTGAFFLLAFFMYRHIHRRLDAKPFLSTRETHATSLVLAAIFTLLYMIVDYHSYIADLTNPLFRMTILTAVSIGFICLFYRLILLLYSFCGDKESLHKLFIRKPSQNYFPIKHIALCCFGLCLLCWLPYFLYHFPGIMTPDSVVQFEQVLGLREYSNHHPVAHTLLIKLFYSIGMLFTESRTVAISLYTMFQMCFMAFCVSYFISTLRLFHIRCALCYIITLFYALVPYHAVFAVTIWKDIIFAGAVLLFSCCLLRFTQKLTSSVWVLFVISGIMLCLFRSNGWYGFCLCLPFLMVYFRKKAKAIYPALLGILAVAIIIKYPIMNKAGVIQPDLIESLSIPTQQIAAVICNDRELTEEQLTLIENVVDLTYIKELYNPIFADNMKELVRAGNQDYLVAHKGEFLKLWAHLLFAYPGDYITAYINQTYGYFYPDSFYLVAEAEGISGSHLGVSHTPLIAGPLVVKAKEISIKLGSMVPIYSLLWSMGVIFWTMLFCMGNAFVRRERAKLVYYLPSLALYLTVMIATPVATEFRYVYFMVFSLPFYLMVALLPETSDNEC